LPIRRRIALPVAAEVSSLRTCPSLSSESYWQVTFSSRFGARVVVAQRRGGLRGAAYRPLPARPGRTTPGRPARKWLASTFYRSSVSQAGSWSLPSPPARAPVDERGRLFLRERRAEPDVGEQFVACGLSRLLETVSPCRGGRGGLSDLAGRVSCGPVRASTRPRVGSGPAGQGKCCRAGRSCPRARRRRCPSGVCRSMMLAAVSAA
jgi:hypothetical protein